MIVYGRQAVREAIRGPRRVSRVWATKNASREEWLPPGGPVEVAGADEIERLCGSNAHQGMCAQVEPFRYGSAEDVLALSEPLIVVLDQVQDPQNLGSICRTAECAGASAVVIPERRAVEVTPAVCKASAGAVEHLLICRVRNVADFLDAAKAAHIFCYGADSGGELSYEELDYRGGVAIVLGSEGRGLRRRVWRTCDEIVAIPLAGRIESLSVSAAAAVLLYHAQRARRGP